MIAFAGRILLILSALAALAAPAHPGEPVAGVPGANLAEVLATADAMRAAGRPAEAYAFLARHEEAFIGDVDFDYALGRAALDAGAPDRATLAFGRVLAVSPDHAGAAIDMARAFLALGNREQARAVLRALIALDPPVDVRARLLELVAAAEQAASPAASGSFTRGYLAAGAGRDTNVNFALAQSRVFVPLFGGELELAPGSRARGDRFFSLSGGVDVQRVLAGPWRLVGGVEISERRHARESAFDLGGVSARGGVGLADGDRLWRMQYQHARTFLDGRGLRTVDAVSVDVRPERDGGVQWLGFGNAGRYRHPSLELRSFDADFLSGGAIGAVRVAPELHVIAGGTLAAETDRGGNPGGDRRTAGVRAGFEWGIAARWTAGFMAVRQATAYERADAAFFAVRHDGRRDAEWTIQHEPGGPWLVRAGLTFTRQKSSIGIYAFERTEFSVSVRRRFD